MKKQLSLALLVVCAGSVRADLRSDPVGAAVEFIINNKNTQTAREFYKVALNKVIDNDSHVTKGRKLVPENGYTGGMNDKEFAKFCVEVGIDAMGCKGNDTPQGIGKNVVKAGANESLYRLLSIALVRTTGVEIDDFIDAGFDMCGIDDNTWCGTGKVAKAVAPRAVKFIGKGIIGVVLETHAYPYVNFADKPSVVKENNQV